MTENMARSSKQHFIWIAAIVLVLASAGYFFIRTGQDRKSVSPPEKVTIAYSATPDSALAQVAQKQGYYLQEGLDATPQMHPLGKFALQALLEGKADFATVAETPVMFAIMKGEKITIIATIQTSERNYVVVARKDKGILSPRDLKGRKMAATLGTSGDYYMDAFLADHGISRKEMKVVDLKPEELREALAGNDVDAIAALPPVAIQVQKKLGDRVITFADEDIYTQFFNVVATQEFIRRNPEKVKKILLALIKAEEFVSQNPAEAQKIVADFIRLDRAFLGEIWGVNRFSVKLDQPLLLALEDQSQWAIKNRFTERTKVPNYLDFIYLDGLLSVKPKSVRILR